MSKPKDLTGQRFGKLVAIRPTEHRNKGAVVWECLCDCGNKLYVRSYSLLGGSTKSCGCSRIEKLKNHRTKDLTGKRFGRLVAIRPIGERKGSFVTWECLCDCGKTTFVASGALLSGNTRSCGCISEENKRKRANDLTGTRFGKLVAIRPTDKRERGRVVWECLCDCGETAFVSGDQLNSGLVKSCGCLKKEIGKQKAKNLSDQRFGRLLAIRPTDKRRFGSIVWECICDCGSTAFVSGRDLVAGSVLSCGCLKKETLLRNSSALPYSQDYVAGTSIDMLKSKKIKKNNTTGFRGVCPRKDKFLAYIGFQNKTYHLGTYTSIEDAVRVRKKAEALLYGETIDYFERWKTRADADINWAKENPVQIKVAKTALNEFVLSFSPKI